MRLMSFTDTRLGRRKSEKLELAILQFFEYFRKVYIGDQSPKGVYSVMKLELGIDDELMVMSIMIRKMCAPVFYSKVLNFDRWKM